MKESPMPLADRLALAAQACHATHLLSCEATCLEAITALQSLSQEAVRDEALEEAAKLCDELAAKHKKMGEKAAIKSGYSAATTNGHINAGCGALQCADLIRALKREPNAAGPVQRKEPEVMVANLDGAPAAPDVASMVKRLEDYYDFQCEGGPLKNCVEWIKVKEALLARLGQGWIPMDRTAEYQEHHFKVEDVGVAWNGNRVWVCADSGALLRAKVIGEKLFVEFTPPAPGASDE